ERRHDGAAAGGEDDVRGGVAAPVHLDGTGTVKTRAARDAVDAALACDAVPVAVDVGNIGLAPANQRLPVGGAAGSCNAEPRRVVHRVSEVRGVPHDLLGYAAAIYTGSAEAVSLDDGDARAELRRAPCNGEPAAATADGNEVIFVTTHGKPLIPRKKKRGTEGLKNNPSVPFLVTRGAGCRGEDASRSVLRAC